MRTHPFAAALLLLAGCSGEPTVSLLPCPAEDFHMEPAYISADGAADGAEMPTEAPRVFASLVAGPPTGAGVAAPASAPAPAMLPDSPTFPAPSAVPAPRLLDAPKRAAKDTRPAAPAADGGFAAAGAGMVSRRPSAPSLIRASELAASDQLASIGGARSAKAAAAADRAAVTKKQAAPVQGLSQAVIAKTVQGQIPRIRACYERVIKHDPDARGKLVMSWNISPDGSVSGVRVESDQVGSEQFQGCAARSVAKWRFPKGVETVAVSYPFVMSPRSY